MAWRMGPPKFAVLQDLGALTARLIRLGALAQVSRGQAQLRAAGMDADLVSAYKGYAIQASKSLKTEKESLLNVCTTSRSTF